VFASCLHWPSADVYSSVEMQSVQRKRNSQLAQHLTCSLEKGESHPLSLFYAAMSSCQALSGHAIILPASPVGQDLSKMADIISDTHLVIHLLLLGDGRTLHDR